MNLGMKPDSVGLGWRQPHYQQLMQEQPALGFIEVHAENFFAEGGAARQLLRGARESYELSLHGVGLSLGSAIGIDPWHLDRLARLNDELQPALVSDHASFARVQLPGQPTPIHGNDLLPIAFNDASLAVMVRNVQQVQDRLRRPLLVENLSAYLRWERPGEALRAEPDFFNELVARSGCGLLLDVNNLMVNALNSGLDAAGALQSCVNWVDRLHVGCVGQIHLAGYCELEDVVIDDHGSLVRPAVWQLYRHVLGHFGPRPSLIEWDTDLPSLQVLLDEVHRAQDCMATSALMEPAHA